MKSAGAAPQRDFRAELAAAPAGSSVTTLALLAVVTAGLYFGRELFVPLALAVLLSFALAPVVRWLRRFRMPRVPAVLTAVALAFLVIGAFGTIVAWQVMDLAESLPRYQTNIERKIDAIRESPPGGSAFSRASAVLERLSEKLSAPEDEQQAANPASPTAPDVTPSEPEPIPVKVMPPDLAPLELLRTIVGPIISPLATLGIVIVFVIFMLLQREDLRDRLIRLAGTRDLQRTTDALDDAAKRVAHYLLMQLVVNVTYGIPIGIGLWLIGVPNAALWGLLAVVLRFVPYIGPVVAAAFPVLLAVAVDPGWTMLLYAAALFIVVELISNNFAEPWLYGASTGLSPVAIITAAIFWTWLWGPIGLLLSTPLTVCLVVLGQHIPQLSFLDVMLGNEPVLTPPENLYQRLLVGDPDEATERAEEYLQEHSLLEFYDEVAVPALALAEQDRVRGTLDESRRDFVVRSAFTLVDNLQDHVDVSPPRAKEDEAEEEAEAEEKEAALVEQPLDLRPEWQDGVVLCAGARGNLDEVAAAMLAQIMERRGFSTRVLEMEDLQADRLKRLDLADVRMICLSYMNPESLAHARYLVRRLKRLRPDVPVMLGFWTLLPEDVSRRDPLAATHADRLASSLSDAVEQVVKDATGVEQDEEKGPEEPLPLRPAAAI